MSADAARRPGWATAVAVVAALAVLVSLGTWQMARRAEKHALIAHIEARLAEPPVVLPARIDDPSAWDYRRVRATGTFLHEHEIHLYNRVRDGTAGVDVVTPLVRADGATVLIDRGWMTRERADPAARAAGQAAGRITVTGIARVPPAPGPFTPPNDPAKGFWLIPDPQAIAAAKRLGETLPIVLEADATPNLGGWPKGGGTRVALPDNHLQYALTWYALAVVLVAVVVAARRRRSKPNIESRPPSP